MLAGRDRPPRGDGFTVADLANHFLTHKKELQNANELAKRTFDAYHATCKFLVKTLGKNRLVEQLGPPDFQKLRSKMSRRWGPVRLKNEMGVVESIFRFGEGAELFERKIRFGSGWAKPRAATLRKNREAKGPKMFTREQALKILHQSTRNMKAMVLLGLNAGLGNTDIALLPIEAFDPKSGWLEYPRPKTGIRRRIPLWPETVKRLRLVLEYRCEPKDSNDAHLLFIGKRGQSYVGGHRGHRVTQEFTRAAVRAGVTGRTFYDLRRTFQTVGEEAADLVAVQSIMGHAAAAGDMSAIYRQRLPSDKRLRAVVEHVRRWLFAKSDSEDEGGEAA